MISTQVKRIKSLGEYKQHMTESMIQKERTMIKL